MIRDAINAGDIPGPRYLANGMEIARRDGELVAGITAFADGPDEMKAVIREHVDLGVDNIKLSMSGEEVCIFRDNGRESADRSPDNRDPVCPGLLLHRRRDSSVRRRRPSTEEAAVRSCSSSGFGENV